MVEVVLNAMQKAGYSLPQALPRAGPDVRCYDGEVLAGDWIESPYSLVRLELPRNL